MLCRERRSWTAKEDQLLREAVQKGSVQGFVNVNPNPSKWHAIAKHVPNRTNKDCRKRWFAKMASDVVKGGWAPDEDEKLVKGIEKYGTRWSLVASVVGTRNSDQCAKRWTDTLNPAIDRTTWTADADEMLLRAVNEHGKVWTKIVKTYFPGRTGLSAKNRYNSITRFNSDHSRGTRTRRRTPDVGPYIAHRKSSSASSSASSSVSPSTPSVPIPELAHGAIQSALDTVPESYLFESLAGWPPSSSSSDIADDITSFYPSPLMFDVKEQALPATPLLDLSTTSSPAHLSFDYVNPSVRGYTDDVAHSPSNSADADQLLSKVYMGEHPSSSQAHTFPYPTSDSFSQYSQYSAGYGSDVSGHLALFDSIPSHGDTSMGWMNAPPLLNSGHHERTHLSGNTYHLF